MRSLNVLTVLSTVAKGKQCLLGWAESVNAVSWESPNMMASENSTTAYTNIKISSYGCVSSSPREISVHYCISWNTADHVINSQLYYFRTAMQQ